jgi:hypothetical protein
MLIRVGEEFKALKYSLKCLVCNEDDSHILITAQPKQIEILADTLMFFKVNVAGRCAGKV